MVSKRSRIYAADLEAGLPAIIALLRVGGVPDAARSGVQRASRSVIVNSLRRRMEDYSL
jgi:hypothetical protein